MSLFDTLPDELLERIFDSLIIRLPLTPHNHARINDDSYYYDYEIQQPILRQNHILLNRTALTCRRFHNIIKSPAYWERRCREEHVILSDQQFPPNFRHYERLYASNPFHPSFNLIQDNAWRKRRQIDTQIEPVPLGSHPLFDEFNRLSPCRVTSYTLAEIIQRNIQLPRVETITNPVIIFSICVAARWDCGARCSISLDFSDGYHWQYEKRIQQWNDQKWHRITYRYSQYDQYPATVTVSVSGCDTQFWAGFFGMKFAQARLQIRLRTNDNVTNEASDVPIERTDEELIPIAHLDPTPDNIPIEDHTSSSSSSVNEWFSDENE